MNKSNRDASASIGACAFHKKTGITRELREIEGHFKKKFIYFATGKMDKKYVAERSCTLCKQKRGRVIFVKNGFEHVRCSCGMIYVPDILKDDYLNLIYGGAEYEKDTHNSFRTEPRKSFIEAVYQEGLELLEKAGIRSGGLFDVGCSTGLFMEYARNWGFAVRGIEPSEYAVAAARHSGLQVSQGYFEGGTVGNSSYDVVSLWDVLEHCKNPDSILAAVYRALVPGGAVFLQVPNVMALAARIMREECNMFTGFGHINLFGPDTLKRMLEKNGFSEIAMQSVISEISIINNYLDYHDPYLGPSLERDTILGCIDIEMIHGNLWGYKLQAVAKKSRTGS